ncbi:MAG TPA: Rieske 2Fe-2S domain-containing protein [Rhodocyclaceae bacterium]|nr:Rieske 2Fe-2S domain-containing protein [Rhodocyclaceae bacterium]
MDWQALPHAPPPGTVICTINDLPASGGRLFWFGPADDKRFGLIVVRDGDDIHAYVNRCAHFGVPLSQTDEHLILKPGKSLVCNVHYARYRWQDGTCESGDCDGENLIPLPLTIAGHQLLIG